MKQGVIVKNITGNVLIQKEGKITNVIDEVKLDVDSENQIIADDKSYALIYNKSFAKQKQGSTFIMFPKSMIIVHTGNGFIQDALILLGMVYASMPPGYKISTHTAEFEGSAFVEALDDGTTTIANTRDTIYNRMTGVTVTMEAGHQVVITMNSISKPKPMDERFHQAQDIVFKLGHFDAISIFKTAQSKSQDFKNAYMMAMKELSAQTGYDISNLDKEMESFDTYNKELHKMEKESIDVSNNITHTQFSTSHTIPIDVTFKYQGLTCTAESVKIEAKPDNMYKITLFMKVANETSKQVFISWYEESRLINLNNQIVDLDDYKIETDFGSIVETSGYLVFLLKGDVNGCRIQFGKKSSPQAEIKIPPVK